MHPQAPGAEPGFKHGPERAEERAAKAHTVDLSSMFPGQLFLHGDPSKKEIALSFDDGPDNRFTPMVLDTLKRLDVKATFFLIGQRVELRPAVVRRIAAEGHAYGNHTYSHANLTKLQPTEIRREVESCDKAIANVTGKRTRLFRPPYGALTPTVVRELIELGYKIIYWNVDSLDWMGLSTEQVTANILAHTGPGDIVLQHAAGGRGEDLSGSVHAIPFVVNTLRKQGYKLLTVPELLDIKDWARPVQQQ